jgi:hypothetical protein
MNIGLIRAVIVVEKETKFFAIVSVLLSLGEGTLNLRHQMCEITGAPSRYTLFGDGVLLRADVLDGTPFESDASGFGSHTC